MNHSYGWSCCGMIAEFAAKRLINCSEKLTNCSPSSQLWYQDSERKTQKERHLISECELSVFQFFLIDRLKAEGKTAKSKIPLGDFLIGAHAEADGMKLVTRDPARVSAYFPQVELIQP